MNVTLINNNLKR